MVARIITVFALVASALAIPAPRAESLKASISAAKSSVNSKDLVIKATVTNPTSEDVRVVKFNTLLDELPSRSFQLFKDDKEVDFQGARITPDVTKDDVYTTIPAGQSVSVEHNLGASYNFASAGTGKYTVKAVTHFQYGAKTSEVVDLKVDSVDVEITSVDSPSFGNGDVSIDQTTPNCGDGNKLNQLRGALSEARALAGGAATDIRSHPNSGAYGRYFGNNNRDDIWYNFDRVAGDLASSGTRTLNCDDAHNVCAGNSGIVAYTWLVTSGDNIISSDIYGCNPFWGAVPTNQICSGAGLGTRGSIILHELSHAVFRSADTVYGCDGSAALNDAGKKGNADNYACFGVQIHHDYNC